MLSDELSPEPMKTDAPMHIHIKAGATPRKVTTARRVPLRYESEAEKTVQELIEKGVIIPANETTDWCSPAFFVPKGDKIRVRLVTDYTELNNHHSASIQQHKGNSPSSSQERESLREIRRRTRLLPAGIGRRKLQDYNVPTTPVSYTHLTLPTNREV